MLLAAAAGVVILVRLRGDVAGNLSILYGAAMIYYANAYDTQVPSDFVYGMAALSLLLRFEFLNGVFTRLLRVIELFVVARVGYLCMATVYGW